MAITKRPSKPVPVVDDSVAQAFISGAPDGSQTLKPQRVRKGKKVQISLTIAEPILDRVDELANQIGQSRAAVINLSLMQMLQSGLRIEGQ